MSSTPRPPEPASFGARRPCPLTTPMLPPERERRYPCTVHFQEAGCITGRSTRTFSRRASPAYGPPVNSSVRRHLADEKAACLQPGGEPGRCALLELSGPCGCAKASASAKLSPQDTAGLGIGGCSDIAVGTTPSGSSILWRMKFVPEDPHRCFPQNPCAGILAPLILRSPVPNKPFDADAQVLQCASRTRLPVAGQLRR